MFSGLGDGIYTVLVRNSVNFCESNPQQVTLTAPSGASILNIITSPTSDCSVADGLIIVDATGGLAPLEYSINGGTTWTTSSVFQNVAAGTYNVQVRNANGTCVISSAQPVVVATPPQPSLISVTPAPSTDCGVNNGSITINATGGIAPLEYSIDGTNWFTNNVFSNLSSGNYTVWVRNQDNSCPKAWPANPISLNGPAAPAISSVTPQNPSICGVNNGSITITATGGTAPLQYSIDNGATWQAGNVFSNLAAGSYNIKVRNANGSCATTFQMRPF